MKPLCSWCKKPIETENHYIVVRTVKGRLLPFNKTQRWEFHTIAEMKAWASHKPKGDE